MAFAQRLDLRQSQQLVMTPQLQQAIKMLQMSNLELREFISDELERNPLLDVGEQQEPPAAQRPEEAAPEASSLDQELKDDRLSKTDMLDNGADNVFADEALADKTAAPKNEPVTEGPSAESFASAEASAWAGVGSGGSSRFDDAENSIEATLGDSLTLREHLIRQLGESCAPAPLRLITSDLIENLDESGYLRADLEEVAHRLGASHTDVEAAGALLRSFEPTGVGARSLAECLALQLQEQNRLDPAMQALLDNLSLLARREFAKLRKACRVDMDDLREMVGEIRALDPKPGLRFDHDVAQTLIPDVYVSENRLAGWTVELNSETLPRLLINNNYAANVRSAPNGEAHEVTEYLNDCQQSANWLIKSIDQRARTILRVASEIVRQQDGFLAYGVSALRPLNLKAVADAIDMHESTISRVTSNKYISTPRGIFELKYFFSPAIASTNGGEAHSAEAIRHRIKTLIDDEPAGNVLSDDKIVAVLRSDGVDIARRTVAKYREALRIPSSVQRRKLKSAEAVL